MRTKPNRAKLEKAIAKRQKPRRSMTAAVIAHVKEHDASTLRRLAANHQAMENLIESVEVKPPKVLAAPQRETRFEEAIRPSAGSQ